jgi:pimeloyl-ACP methyl ester carboxylesterase
VNSSSLISQVENLKTPTLLFWGKYDIILPWWTDGKTCARALPNAKLVLTKTGHAPHAETSELFIEETSGFLKTLNN